MSQHIRDDIATRARDAHELAEDFTISFDPDEIDRETLAWARKVAFAWLHLATDLERLIAARHGGTTLDAFGRPRRDPDPDCPICEGWGWITGECSGRCSCTSMSYRKKAAGE